MKKEFTEEQFRDSWEKQRLYHNVNPITKEPPILNNIKLSPEMEKLKNENYPAFVKAMKDKGFEVTQDEIQ